MALYGRVYTQDVFTKQPWETFLIGADFSEIIEEGEYLLVNSCDIVAVDKNGEDVSSTILNNTQKTVTTAASSEITATPVTNALLKTRVLAGTEALSKYKITFKGVTSNGNQYEKDVHMAVRDQ